MSADSHHAAKEQFTRLFGGEGKIHAVRAPGRVNLIGEHTDYNDGYVFPMAVEAEVGVIFRSRNDDVIKVASTVYPNEFEEFSVSQKIERGKSWGNYVRGVAAELIGAGLHVAGMDALVTNTLPVGGGLSSSAALEVAIAKALLLLAGHTVVPERLALICQKAEHEYPQVPCGIMDQMIVAGAKAGHAMMLDCRDLSKQFVPIDPVEIKVMIVNSMVGHELSGGEYGVRRRQCEEGMAILRKANPAAKALRDVTMKQIDTARGQMSELVYRRCRHVVTENARTLTMANVLSQRHYDEAGELMLQSHNSLRDDYEVSCPELDFLVEQASKTKGVYGARMTGGGFGGCIVALVQPRFVESIGEQLHKSYTARFGRQPVASITTATAGASVIE